MEKIFNLFFNLLEIPQDNANYRKNLYVCYECKRLAPYSVFNEHNCEFKASNSQLCSDLTEYGANLSHLPKKPKSKNPNLIKIDKFFKKYKKGYFYKVGEGKERPFRDPEDILNFKMKLKEIVNEENFFNDNGKY